MAILIDDAAATMFQAIPVREGWVASEEPFELRSGLRAADVGEDDVALIPAPEATLLTRTHVIDRSAAVVFDGVGMLAMRTPVRPDEIESETVYLQGVGVAGEALVRALLKPFFGIEATGFERAEESPEDARVLVVEGPDALVRPEHGFSEDLARSWFIMTGKAYVSHVTVIGVRALARGAETAMAALRSAFTTGWERRRDIRRLVRETSGVDADSLAEITGRMRFALTPEDQEPLRMLVERGAWGTDFGRTLPAFRDQIALADQSREGDDG